MIEHSIIAGHSFVTGHRHLVISVNLITRLGHNAVTHNLSFLDHEIALLA